MSEETKRSILINSRIVVWIVAATLFVLGLILVAQGFIDTHNYRDGILEVIKKQTGRDVTIKGKVSVWLVPTPTIYIPGVELRDPTSDTPAPAATIDMIKLKVPFDAVFSDHPRVTAISLEHPVLELVRASDNIIHWEWLNADLLKLLTGQKGASAPPTVEISDGRIMYHDNRTDKGIVIDHISAGVIGGAQVDVRSQFTLLGHDIRLIIDTDAGKSPVPPGAMPLNLKLTADHNQLQLQGSMDLSGNLPKIKGALNLDAENVMSWLHAKGDDKAPAAVADIIGIAPSAPLVIPAKLNAEWTQDGDTIALADIHLDGFKSVGTGKAELTGDKWRPVVAADMAFSTMDYDQWQTFVTEAFLTKPDDAAQAKLYHSSDEPTENPLPAELRLTLNVTADQVNFGEQIWKEAKLSAKLADAAITVNQFHIALPGEATMGMFGIISEGTTGGMRFDGSMETQGKSLRHMLTVIDPSAADLPETGFGDFYARSNLFVSAEQLRLSEADVKISDLRLNGGLVAYFDANPRLEADVKLKDINFDYFRDAWRDKAKQQAAQQQDFFLKFDRTMNFDWLKKLRTNIDLKVNVDGFTFLERKGDNASFRIFAKDGTFGIYDMRFNYPGDTMEASFTLDVKGEQPAINVMLNADEINTDYFSMRPHAAAPADKMPPPPPLPPPAPQTGLIGSAFAADAPQLPAPPPPSLPPAAAAAPAAPVAVPANAPGAPKFWSEDLIDMSWMQGFNGAFDISIGKLNDGKVAVENLKMLAKLDNNVLTFQNFSFSYWQGRCSVGGSIYGGQVPGISISFTLYNAELHDILHDLISRDNITGRVSISGTLATSGVNSLSWVSQADSKLVLAGRGINVQGVNLQGVVDAVMISRTAADVFNNVNLAFSNGPTEFNVDGNINIKNGLMKTPGVTLKAGAVTGDLTGEVRLVPWTMDLSTLFQFPAMTSETIPTMTVQLSGPVAAAGLRTDTSSLESYVAKRIISR